MVSDFDFEKLEAELDELRDQVDALTVENDELRNKLLIYEHDPIIVRNYGDNFQVCYWDKESEEYKLFACFFTNNMETDMEEFCKDFVLELKDAYMVE